MARKNFGPQTYLYPLPVLIIGSYDENNNPNAMNAAWGGISDYNQISICLSMHKTTENILKSKAFTVSIATSDQVIPCDYVGIVSLSDCKDKMEKSGFTTSKSSFVNAPIIHQLPMCLECNLVSFDKESGIMIGSIVNVSCDEKYLTDGKIDPAKIKPITYDPVNHTYIELGNVVGKAFLDGKKIK